VTLFRQFRPLARASYHLTPQEIELLKLMVEGHHYKTAASAMGISTNTISFHLEHIYEKLQVHRGRRQSSSRPPDLTKPPPRPTYLRSYAASRRGVQVIPRGLLPPVTDERNHQEAHMLGRTSNSMTSLPSAGNAAVNATPSSAPARDSTSSVQIGPLFSRGPQKDR